MDVTLKHQPTFSLAIVKLAPNEQIKVEPGAMASHTFGMVMETKAGGLFSGLKRMAAGESFFQNTWKAPGEGGEITLTTNLLGDMIVLDMGGGGSFLLASGSYVASEMGISIDSSWGGAKGFFGGAGIILLKVSGQGKVIASSFGAIEERTLAAGQKYTVDTGHIVGFSPLIKFTVKKSGSWKSTILGGEGLVCELTGPGRVLMQTRSMSGFVSWLMPMMPTKSQ